LSFVKSPSNPFNVRFIKYICFLNFVQNSFDASHISVGGSSGILYRMFDKNGNGTIVFVRPNAGPINICLKYVFIKNKMKFFIYL
jgi:hypothetical protein